jgi:large subunit ribosomal protein L35
MPKMKTNKMASKKFRVMGSGRVKRKQANTSHNTAKRAAKRMRHLRGTTMVDSTNLDAVAGLLPNHSVK